MPYYDFFWDDETIEHLCEHGVSPEDFIEIVCDPLERGRSRSSGRRFAAGFAADGRYLFCVYEHLDDMTVIPITAYEPDAQG
jgi:uncharacterized DUF497 family protein